MPAVSRLAYQGDDYPVASKKHLDDAEALANSRRHVGCAYLAGYVVECALKTVLLFEASWESRAGTYDPRKLADEQARLRLFSHGLRDLFEEVTRVCAAATSRSQRYLPKLSAHAAILSWEVSLRYRPPSYLMPIQAQEMLTDARKVYQQTIEMMARDQVL